MDQVGGYLSITVAEEEGQHIGMEGKYKWPPKNETWASVQIKGTEPRRKPSSVVVWREGHGQRERKIDPKRKALPFFIFAQDWPSVDSRCLTMWEIGWAFSLPFRD